ncbi:MAG: 16S rRNA (adenine(1518)-N(6)/adenine(1519)-N(6))-dimethyltransferase RsmA [Sumerlaeia bacterium]
MTEFVFPPIADLLRQQGIWLSKHKSQHFLRNAGVCAQIADVAGLSAAHVALEIGAGAGNLTVELARRAGDVLAIEMDRAFAEWHTELQGRFENLTIEYADFLKTDLDSLPGRFPGRPLVAVGNLPYQITAPILFKIVESGVPFERLVFMVQREVAERIVTGVPGRRASALTYKLAFLYNTRIAMKLGPNEFLPPPKVNSAVVVLEPRPDSLLRDNAHRVRAFRVVHQIFQHRRRSLANAMSLGLLTPTRQDAEAVLTAASVDPGRRAETLSLEEIVAIEAALSEFVSTRG